MNTRPNEAQKMYNMYASIDYPTDSNNCDAYEGCSKDDNHTSDDVKFFDENGISYCKAARRERRRGTAMAKRKFFKTAQVVSNNLRARFAEVDANPYSVDKSHTDVAFRIIKKAQKMGMDIK